MQHEITLTIAQAVLLAVCVEATLEEVQYQHLRLPRDMRGDNQRTIDELKQLLQFLPRPTPSVRAGAGQADQL